MVILEIQNKITDFFMILAWASPFNVDTVPPLTPNTSHTHIYTQKSNFTRLMGSFSLVIFNGRFPGYI